MTADEHTERFAAELHRLERGTRAAEMRSEAGRPNLPPVQFTKGMSPMEGRPASRFSRLKLKPASRTPSTSRSAQRAKLLSRAVMSLSRLWRQQGKCGRRSAAVGRGLWLVYRRVRDR